MIHDFISPLYDFAFTQIFGCQENIDNTRAFLKTLLDIPQEDYDELTVVNPVLKKLSRRKKTGVVDLRLTTKTKKIIHIELQINKRANLRNRILYYAARLIGDQLNWGDDYDKLHQVISIVICDHKLLKEEEDYINEYELRNKKNRSFTKMLKVIILELPKLPDAEDGAVWPWLKFLKCKTKEDYEMLARKYPEMKKPVYCAEKMSLIEKWRNIRFHQNLWKVDERMLQEQIRLDKEEARQEGREKGLAEGRVEGLAEGREKGLAEGHAEGRKEAREHFLELLKSGKSQEEILRLYDN